MISNVEVTKVDKMKNYNSLSSLSKPLASSSHRPAYEDFNPYQTSTNYGETATYNRQYNHSESYQVRTSDHSFRQSNTFYKTNSFQKVIRKSMPDSSAFGSINRKSLAKHLQNQLMTSNQESLVDFENAKQ